ncbi:MAG: response regulator transcription factor [Lachnospiraceae bacterium]|nr:response regulator transcription factor [Lachnospiraceae bacterium]
MPSTSTPKILLIEDDPLIREELHILLSNAGYTVDSVTDFGTPLNQVRSFSPDLILLDINLPGQDGYALCTSIRSFSATPILFITGRNTAMDELQALTLGGDDYITKPYNIPILLARINLLLRRYNTASVEAYQIEYKGIQLNPVAGTLRFEAQEIELTKTELKIMHYLFTHPNEIIPRLELVEYLWDNEIHIDDNTLSVNIMRIRDKLRSLGAADLIQTKRGMGYKI